MALRLNIPKTQGPNILSASVPSIQHPTAMSVRFSVALAFLACAAYASGSSQLRGAAVPPPRWGGNDTTLSFTSLVNMTNQNTDPAQPYWQFMYYYNDELNASKYVHGVGQSDEVCAGVPNQPSQQPCTVTNSVDGFTYLSFPTTSFCCKCAPVFTIRSDWMQDGGTTYLGTATVRGFETNEWVKQGAEFNHYYATADGEERPVRFMEHKFVNGQAMLKQWDFMTWSPQPVPPTEFSAPSGCASTCNNYACKVLNQRF